MSNRQGEMFAQAEPATEPCHLKGEDGGAIVETVSVGAFDDFFGRLSAANAGPFCYLEHGRYAASLPLSEVEVRRHDASQTSRSLGS